MRAMLRCTMLAIAITAPAEALLSQSLKLPGIGRVRLPRQLDRPNLSPAPRTRVVYETQTKAKHHRQLDAQESLRISGGLASDCRDITFEEYYLRYYSQKVVTGEHSEIMCVAADGKLTTVGKLGAVKPNAVASRWHGQSPNKFIGSQNFWSAVGVDETSVSRDLARQRGSSPVFSIVSAYLARDRFNGDYLLPFCYANHIACTSHVDRADGLLIIRRSDSEYSGSYALIDISAKVSRVCKLAGMATRCFDHRPFADPGPGSSGLWDVKNFWGMGVDNLVISFPYLSSHSQADRDKSQAEYRANRLADAKANAAADLRACQDYRDSGGFTMRC